MFTFSLPKDVLPLGLGLSFSLNNKIVRKRFNVWVLLLLTLVRTRKPLPPPWYKGVSTRKLPISKSEGKTWFTVLCHDDKSEILKACFWKMNVRHYFETYFAHLINDYILVTNRPFYRYSGHIELIRLRSSIGCPGGMSTFCLYFRAFFGTLFCKVFLE